MVKSMQAHSRTRGNGGSDSPNSTGPELFKLAGKAKDVTYPRLTVVLPRPGQVLSAPDSLGLFIALQIQDDSAEVRAEWPFDPKGDSWMSEDESSSRSLSF